VFGAVLPALVGFGLISRPPVAGMATVAAIAGGLKAGRHGRGFLRRWMQRPGPWTGAASID